jgi:hypothetical protein
MIPAIMALVVAIAGMMLPAISEDGEVVNERLITATRALTFDFPATLSGNAICCGTQVGGRSHEVKCIIVVFVKRYRFFTRPKTRSQPMCAKKRNN